MDDTIDLVRKLVMSRDEAGIEKLLHEWRAKGVSRTEAYENLITVWRELTVESNDCELDFLSNWIDVVEGNVGPGARIWPHDSNQLKP